MKSCRCFSLILYCQILLQALKEITQNVNSSQVSAWLLFTLFSQGSLCLWAQQFVLASRERTIIRYRDRLAQLFNLTGKEKDMKHSSGNQSNSIGSHEAQVLTVAGRWEEKHRH